MAITSETWAYFLGPDNLCRSIDCDDVAEFTVSVPEYRPMRVNPSNGKHPVAADEAKGGQPEWGGNFCKPHLLRVLELYVEKLHFHQPLKIERIHRA